VAAPFDPEGMQLLGPAVALVDNAITFHMSSGALVYSSGGPTSNDTELVWVTRSGDATPVEEGWFFDAGGSNVGWALSPDGTRIALRRIGPDGNSDIWIKELPGGPLRRLTFDEGDQRVPFWTPDGAHVAYFTTQGEIWRSRADGTGNPELISAAPPGFVQGVWTPDGQSLVLRSLALQTTPGPPGARDLLVARRGADSVAVPLVATAQYAEQDPSLSRDGRWLAYTSNETGRNEVYVRPFPEVDRAKIQVSSEGGFHPQWSHDGRELFYVDADRSMVAVQFDGGSDFRMTSRQALFSIPPGYAAGVGINVIDVHPEGDRFLMGRRLEVGASDPEEFAPRFVLVLNFDDELRRRVPR
jgi:serine/threonine-protein kinase